MSPASHSAPVLPTPHSSRDSTLPSSKFKCSKINTGGRRRNLPPAQAHLMPKRAPNLLLRHVELPPQTFPSHYSFHPRQKNTPPSKREKIDLTYSNNRLHQHLPPRPTFPHLTIISTAATESRPSNRLLPIHQPNSPIHVALLDLLISSTGSQEDSGGQKHTSLSSAGGGS